MRICIVLRFHIFTARLDGRFRSVLPLDQLAPLASAYTVDDGHYFETYFYRGERAQPTIHLRDGKVYSVFPR